MVVRVRGDVFWEQRLVIFDLTRALRNLGLRLLGISLISGCVVVCAFGETSSKSNIYKFDWSLLLFGQASFEG